MILDMANTTLLVLMVFNLAMLFGVHSQQQQDVANAVHRLLAAKNQARSEMEHMFLHVTPKIVAYDPKVKSAQLKYIKKSKGDVGLQNFLSGERLLLKRFVNTLKILKLRAQTFYDAAKISSMDGSSRKNLDDLKKYTKNNEQRDNMYGAADWLLASFTLSYKNDLRAGFLFHKIRRSVSKSGKVQMASICSSIKRAKDHDPHSVPDLNEITLTEICPDVKSCTSKKTIYSNKQQNRIPLKNKYMEGRRKNLEKSTDLKLKYKEHDVSKACTQRKCNLPHAIPMMTGMLKYQVNEVIFQNLCPQNCKAGKCDSEGIYSKLIEDINRLIGFIASLPVYYGDSFWPQFFKSAVSRRAFANLDLSLNMVEGKKDEFEISSFQCHLAKFDNACPCADIFSQFTVIKKIKQRRQVNIRIKDLRQHSQMNHAEMLKLQRDDLKHVQLLGNIKQLDNNLKASVKGISKYFEGLAKFDEGIALADVGYIKTSLDSFETSLATVESKLVRDIAEAMNLMVFVLTANVATAIAKLAAAIATNSNPLKIIFTSPDVTDIMDRADDVANAVSDAVRGTALIFNVQKLADGAFDLNKAFAVNSGQLDSLDSLVKRIRADQINSIGYDADRFLTAYGDYTPKADLSELEKNNALWSAFKDSVCDILYGDVGVAGSIPKSIAGGKLVCEKLEGTLAQYFTLRAQIFDFQFDLVDSLAAVIRGNLAKRLSANIKGSQDLLDAKQLMGGFFLAQCKIQKVSSVYCDVLEYKRLGRPVTPCATTDGLFRDQNIQRLIAYSDNTPHTEITRDVYIPTRAQENTDIDTGIIDLYALSKGQKVVFKIPVDQTWLQKYHWLLPGETVIPFIKSIKLYLPHKVYDNNRVLTTQVTLTSVAGSSVTTTVNPTTGVVYMLPRAQNAYRTIYQEGYSSCSSTEIDNPYSLCNNLPKMCDKTNRISSSQSLLPTILSTFSLEAKITQGQNTVIYDAPNPGTVLLLRAKAILKMLPSNTKKSDVPQLSPRSGVVMSKDGCCKGQNYRLSLDDKSCGPCPRGTTSYHGGLYCQINEKKTK